MNMKRALLWVLAVLFTLASVVFQWMTGPTRPLPAKVLLCGNEISYRLERSAENTSLYRIKVKAPQPVSGFVQYMRFKKGDVWKPEKGVPMIREGETLVAPLAWPDKEDGLAPMAGKLAYSVNLFCRREEPKDITGGKPVIIRFKGAVPAWILIPHILVMFLAMLAAVRGGLEALRREGQARKYALWTVILLFIGGFILGPLIQKLSFGSWWTGFPLGFDLTDNKTLIAFVGWLVALLAGGRGRRSRWWVLGAALLMLVVYFIPHSLLGSELDYTKMTP
jgi:hypothetical protein